MLRRFLPLLLAGGTIAALCAGGLLLNSTLQSVLLQATDPTRPQALALAATQTAEASRATLTATAQQAAVQAAQTAQYGAWPWVLVFVFVGGCALVGLWQLRQEAGLDWAAVEAAAESNRQMAPFYLAEPGATPIPLAHLLADPTFVLALEAERTRRLVGMEAAQPQYPLLTTLQQHHAPSWSHSVLPGQAAPTPPLALAGAEPAQLALPAFVPPTMGHLIEQGAFRDGRYLPAYSLTGAPLWLPAEQGRSYLAAGVGGSGKSTALVAAALQELPQPYAQFGLQEPPRFIVLDVAANRAQSLTQRLRGMESRIAYAARTPDEVRTACRAFETEGKRRVDTGIARFSLILIADEVSAMYDDPDFDEVTPLLTEVFLHANTQYRAVWQKAIVGVHMLQAYAFGGRANIRKSFRVRAGYQLDNGDGPMLGLSGPLAQKLITLQPGQCIVLAPGLTPQIGVSPNVAPGDVERAMIATGDATRRVWTAAPPAVDPPFVTARVASPEASEASTGPMAGVRIAPPEASEASTRQEQARALLAQGKRPAEVVRQLWGLQTNTGGRADAAMEELTGWIAAWLQPVPQKED
jgi:hypothetical protein